MATSNKSATTTVKPEKVPEWMLARTGVQLLINNKAEEAVSLFQKYPDSLPMYAGYAFAVFMDALMSLEDDKLTLALNTLRETEQRCVTETGWLKSVQRKMFGATDQQKKTLAETLETQIILADSQVCIALLTFLQQDLSGYFKGGWVLRKSWKVYQHTYREISRLYTQIVGETRVPDQTDCLSTHALDAQMDISPEDVSPSTVDWDIPADSHPSSTNTKAVNGYQKSNFNPTVPRSQSAHFPKPSHTHKDYLTSPTSPKASFNMKKSFSVNNSLSPNYGHRERGRIFGSMNFLPFSGSLSSFFSSSLNMFALTKIDPDIDEETITRLMGAISFGYGLFQLGVSLLPQSLLKITSFLGFGGDKRGGIECLMYARTSSDMRAPLATLGLLWHHVLIKPFYCTRNGKVILDGVDNADAGVIDGILALLWYHTIIRPFYALDGRNVQAGVTEAEMLIKESPEYEDSALFLFFHGRVYRLKSEIPKALVAFQDSVQNASQREIKVLSMHEVAWCHLIQLDYPNAEDTFQQLKIMSRWSRSFYAYLASICAGCTGNLKDVNVIVDMKGLFINGPKGSQLEEFLGRRYNLYPTTQDKLLATDVIYWKLLVYELLYLWNTLPSCNEENINKILWDCALVVKDPKKEPMLGLSKLIEGACFCITKAYDRGSDSFRECLRTREGTSHSAEDAHISAFAMYELGSLLIKNPETLEEGKALLVGVSSYNGFDFESRLNVRVTSLLKNA